ncbi:hypothetical protein ACFWN7_01935 [Agromyces sp. NPDC058484]|uniref:hypothetical protein n=1 Tax=Agromyces sp. NPDC058484 TaxID=3346524 RepID=UPI00366315C8
MDISGMNPADIFLGHVGGQLALAADLGNERLYKRILRGYLDGGFDVLDLLAWQSRELGAAFSQLAALTGGPPWQETIKLRLLDIEASLPVAVAEEEERDRQDEE